MFEGIRRDISHRREAKGKAVLKGLEKERRLSYMRVKRLKEREASEESLKEQVGVELTAREAAKRSYGERKRMERELRLSRGPGVGTRLVRGTKRVFYDIPVKAARATSKLGKGQSLRRALIGDTSLILGTPAKPSQPKVRPTQSAKEFIFGSPESRPTLGNDSLKDILK